MKSFDKISNESESNDTAKNNKPLADDFISRRKKDTVSDEKKLSESKEETVNIDSELSLVQKEPKMTVMTVKGKGEVINTSEKKKGFFSVFATDNIVEKKKKKSPVRTVAAIALVFMLAFFTINEYMLINEYSNEIADMKDTLEELSEEKDFYLSELDKRNNMLEIEAYASGELGMISGKDDKAEYIEISENDIIELYDTTDDNSESLASMVMSALGENLVRAWNTLTGAE